MANQIISSDNSPRTYLGAYIGASDTVLRLSDTSGFPDTGTVNIYRENAFEIVSYTSKDSVGLSGLTRGDKGTTAISHDVGEKVVLTAWVPVLDENSTVATVLVPMSQISAPVKSTVDSINAHSDPAAFHDASDFATAAQGTKADTALQPGAIAPATHTKITYGGNGLVTSGSDITASDVPVLPESKISGLTADLATKADSASVTTALTLKVDKTTTVNGHPLSANVTVTSPDLGLAAVATSGAYADLSGKPTLGTASAQNVGAFAAAAQGAKADTALQSAPVSSVFTRTGAVAAVNGDYNTSQVTENTNLYYTQARFDTAFAAKSTTNLSEGTNQYFTAARVLAVAQAGISFVTATAITAADTVLSAFGKLQAQITALATVARTGAYADLTGKPTIPTAITVYNASGTTTETKRLIATYTPSTASGATLDISAAGFTSILGIQAICIFNTSTGNNCPNVSIKSYTNSVVTINIVQGASTAVSILGINVLGLVFPASVTGITVSLTVEGN